ncbi:MAG TPA: ComF family protein [Virgibacillus sp.]|nr:ComF family protein [Virgibacillus sp.]
MVCLWCDEEIIIDIHWGNLFLLDRPKQICSQCESELEMITQPHCKFCSRHSKDSICSDCNWWKNNVTNDPLLKNISIYTYNDVMRDIIAKWKYRGDYVLIHMFRHVFRDVFIKQFASYAKEALIVPIPLSTERLKERGFNQAEALAKLLPGEKANILIRKHSEKQSKKTRAERLSSNNPFIMKEKINKRVILVDDIYTTGTTLRHAAEILRDNGCPVVDAYTLIRG